MALETSRDAYEQLYGNTAPEEQDKYYEGYVEMKTGLLVCCEMIRIFVLGIFLATWLFDIAPLKANCYITEEFSEFGKS
jgi:hypothetical protein